MMPDVFQGEIELIFFGKKWTEEDGRKKK